MKAKVTQGAKTIYLMETKEVTIELEDGTEVIIRQMEDDNGTETYFWMEELGEWVKPYEYKGERGEEFIKTVEHIANGLFLSYWIDEQEFDWNEVTDPFDEEY